MSASAAIARALGHVGRIGRAYPHAWRQIDEFRAQRRELGDWPEWCHCPLAGAVAAVTEGGRRQVPRERAGDIAAVGGLAAWRATQGVYEVDPTLLASLLDSDLTGEIPVSVLYRLPEWCIYVPLPASGSDTDAVVGFFAHLEYDAGDHRTELRLLLDVEGLPWLVPIPLHVWVPGGIVAAVDRAIAEADFATASLGLAPTSRKGVSDYYRACGPLVSVVLYICSRAAEIRGQRDHERRPARGRSSGKAATAPTVWDVGYRIGPALRAAIERERASGDGTHASPRPHVRRAHWHGYWTGPRDGERTLDLRWQPPVAVGTGEVTPTVRRVR